MNFAMLPPEVNSARMYAGAGRGPMLAAAATWDGLAAELQAGAASFGSLTSGLAGEWWQGPASVAMAAAAAPYLQWLGAAADQAERAAGQARAAATAFESALATTVPPAAVAANQAQLVSMVASNLFGQNAPAIAAAEAEYEQMWAQNVAAMVGYYADASVIVAGLTQWQHLQRGLSSLLNRGSNNIGFGNTGNGNVGFGNTGNGNVGFGNSGSGSVGFGNTGNRNIGIWNTGNDHIGMMNPGWTVAGDPTAKVITNGMPSAFTAQPNVALIMGGTAADIPFGGLPLPAYVANINGLYVQLNNPGYTPFFLVTPEKLWPLTGLYSLPFDLSVNQGVANLHTAIMTQYAAGNSTVVVGVSQSATVVTVEMRNLAMLPLSERPLADQLSFILLGNPDNPNGGLLARFPGQFIQPMGFSFFGATPDNVYPTTVYTLEYDGAADFPQYPLNILSDVNALMGFVFGHGTYTYLTPEQIGSAIQLPTQGETMTTYYMIPVEGLPMLIPLRWIPFIGHPLAALIEPGLRVMVNLGYGNLEHGWSQGPANVPTPFGWFPPVPPGTVAAALQQGAVQGVRDAIAALELPPPVGLGLQLP